MYRKRLTDAEYNAITNLTAATHLDQVFDLGESIADEEDYWIDYEEEQILSLKEGLDLLYSGLAYSLFHEGLTEEESKLIYNLFIEFDVEKEENLQWLLDKGE